MGSAGSGNFGTYRIGDVSGVDVGGVREVECPEIIDNIRIEDVATSEFYAKLHSLPEANSRVRIRGTIYLGRLVVETSDTNEVIGNIPTKYNYLINCIKRGLTYNGIVIASGTSPIPFVVVTLSV